MSVRVTPPGRYLLEDVSVTARARYGGDPAGLMSGLELLSLDDQTPVHAARQNWMDPFWR